jgi:hypothetical protein
VVDGHAEHVRTGDGTLPNQPLERGVDRHDTPGRQRAAGVADADGGAPFGAERGTLMSASSAHHRSRRVGPAGRSIEEPRGPGVEVDRVNHVDGRVKPGGEVHSDLEYDVVASALVGHDDRRGTRRS